MLWSKPLPSGELFALSTSTPRVYLHHHSMLGDFRLTSDSVIPSFTRWKSMQTLLSQLSETEHEAFRGLGYTIGGMLVFPGNVVDRKPTINGARGFSRLVADRLDLTLECIRRHYLQRQSPLGDALARYADFFALFGDFSGYVSFFLLDDLIDQTGSIQFLGPFDDFSSAGVPRTLDSYLAYRRRTYHFVESRNRRISAWASEHVTAGA
jgi:hypothetical protein